MGWWDKFSRYAVLIGTSFAMGNLMRYHTVWNATMFLADVASSAGVWYIWIEKTFKYEVQMYIGGELVLSKKFLSKEQQQSIVDLLLEAGATRMENV